MSKTKIILLCVASAVLASVLTLFARDLLIKSNPTALSVDGPTQVNIGDVVEYKASIKNPPWMLHHTTYQWSVMDKNGPVAFRSISDGNIIFPAGSSTNTYYVVCSGVVDHNYIVRTFTEPLGMNLNKVVVGNDPNPGPAPPPPPPPPPPPGPGPQPVPVTEHLYAIAVFDNTTIDQLPPGQISVKSSQTIATTLGSLQTAWMWRDKADPALTSEWQGHIQQTGVPCLFIVNDSGKIYFNGKLPADESGVISQVKSVRSGK